MKNHPSKSLALLLTILLLAVCSVSRAQQPRPEPPPDDARGNWIIYSKDTKNGEVVAKFVQIKQDGSRLSGHFKSPNQSGEIEGSVKEHHIEFSTKTSDVLTFRGKIDGNTMSGLYGLNGRNVAWHAVRSD